MEQLAIDFIKGFDIQTLIGMAIIFWFMTKGMRHDLGSLNEKVQDIDRRLCRIEGAMTAKDCCMLKDERQIKKAE